MTVKTVAADSGVRSVVRRRALGLMVCAALLVMVCADAADRQALDEQDGGGK